MVYLNSNKYKNIALNVTELSQNIAQPYQKYTNYNRESDQFYRKPKYFSKFYKTNNSKRLHNSKNYSKSFYRNNFSTYNPQFFQNLKVSNDQPRQHTSDFLSFAFINVVILVFIIIVVPN